MITYLLTSDIGDPVTSSDLAELTDFARFVLGKGIHSDIRDESGARVFTTRKTVTLDKADWFGYSLVEKNEKNRAKAG